MKLELGFLREKDIPALLKLAEEIGWGYNTNNWLNFFRLGHIVGHRLEGNVPISCAVMIRYDKSLCWLTSFIVSPQFQRRGLAQELWTFLKKVIPSPLTPVGLVSTEEGLPFYTAMGFRQTGFVYKYIRSNGIGFKFASKKMNHISEIKNDDFEELCALDEKVRGVYRGAMIEEKLKSAIRAVKSTTTENNINGFAIATMEGDLLCIGPVIAADQLTANALILNAGMDSSRPIRLDILPGNDTLIMKLKENGFTQSRVAPVLTYGTHSLPPTLPEYIAIAAQALG